MSFRNNHSFIALLMLSLFAFYGSVTAAEKLINDAWDDFYLGFGVGQSQFDKATFCGDVGRSCDLTEHSQKLFAGYEFNSFFSTEFGYMRYGEFELLQAGADKAMTEVDALFINSFLSYPIYKWISVFGKLGYNKWSSDGSLSNEGVFADNKGYDVSYGLGMSFSFGKDIGIRTEWERLSLDNDDSDSLTGSLVFSF